MASKVIDQANGISADAVKSRTGRSWSEWTEVLDGAGAAALTHREIAAYLGAQHGIGPWWQQMVTVGYEQLTGRRVKHQTAEGFQVSRTRTIGVPVAEVFAAWKDRRKRSRWLEQPGCTLRKATTDRSLRITWVDGQSTLDVMLYPKGEEKCQVTVDHRKLASRADAERMKAYWTRQLDRLKAMLEAR